MISNGDNIATPSAHLSISLDLSKPQPTAGPVVFDQCWLVTILGAVGTCPAATQPLSRRVGDGWCRGLPVLGWGLGDQKHVDLDLCVHDVPRGVQCQAEVGQD